MTDEEKIDGENTDSYTLQYTYCLGELMGGDFLPFLPFGQRVRRGSIIYPSLKGESQ